MVAEAAALKRAATRKSQSILTKRLTSGTHTIENHTVKSHTVESHTAKDHSIHVQDIDEEYTEPTIITVRHINVAKSFSSFSQAINSALTFQKKN